MSDPADPGHAGNAAQIAYWNDQAGLTWTTLQESIDALLAPFAAILLQAAAPAPGERVIDIGSGCGATLLELAAWVGPGGHVLGVDVSEPMSARARERIAAQRLANAAVVVADAAVHVFPRNGADLLFSRFGVMFFADPAAAFANLRRAVRPGGRLVCAAWRPLADNPWARVPLEAARHVLPPSQSADPNAPDPNAPGPFALAAAERVGRILAEAGWRQIEINRHDAPMRLAGVGQIAEAAEFATRVGPLARALADAGPELRGRARQAVAAALAGHDGPDGVTLPASSWIFAARA